MKTTLLFAGLLAAAPPVLGATISFESDTVGQPPAGWTCGATGKGSPRWTIARDDSAPSPPNVL